MSTYELGKKFPGGAFEWTRRTRDLSGAQDSQLDVIVSRQQVLKLLTVHASVGTVTRQDKHGCLRIQVQEPVGEISTLQAEWLCRALEPVVKMLMAALPTDETLANSAWGIDAALTQTVAPERGEQPEPAPATPEEFRTTILVTEKLANSRRYDHAAVEAVIQKLNQERRKVPIVLHLSAKQLLLQQEVSVPASSIVGYADDFQIENHTVSARIRLNPAAIPDLDLTKLAFRTMSTTKARRIEDGLSLEISSISMIVAIPAELATQW